MPSKINTEQDEKGIVEKKKSTILSLEVSEIQSKKFSEKCAEIKIDETEALELLVKGFLKDKFKFETTTIVKHSI